MGWLMTFTSSIKTASSFNLSSADFQNFPGCMHSDPHQEHAEQDTGCGFDTPCMQARPTLLNPPLNSAAIIVLCV